jgi:hypothetical protein
MEAFIATIVTLGIFGFGLYFIFNMTFFPYEFKGRYRVLEKKTKLFGKPHNGRWEPRGSAGMLWFAKREAHRDKHNHEVMGHEIYHRVIDTRTGETLVDTETDPV